MLFLDEPLSGVDPRMADGIISVLIGRQRRTPRTFITVSHDVTMWSPLACRTLLIEDCRLVEAGHTQLSVETGAPGNE
jgi:ABC-type glutathione transport system ATPase component